jgi:nicotinamide-nucleotide amidase
LIKSTGLLITTVPGSSKYFKGSVVSYSNEVKVNVLNVLSDDIQLYGAVSRQVVEQMADNVRKLLKTDYALATSGIAGPDGGTAEKPVGLVWISVSSPKGVVSREFKFGNVRIQNIERTAQTAMLMLKEVIEE